MPDALARARRLRLRALECERLAASSQPEFAKHYHLIAKHYLALARLDEAHVAASMPPTEVLKQQEQAHADQLRRR